MRLDKFLKVSRIIKRRTVAKNFAASERIMVNGRWAKPATEIQVGDMITLFMGDKKYRYQVLEVKENTRAAEASSMYKILDPEEP